MVPRWFVRLLGITPVAARVPITIAGQDYGSIMIETDPNNEILEVWNDLGDGFIVLALFFGLNILLIYLFIGRALRPLDQLAGALEQIGHGDYKMRIGGNSVPELSRLQCSFNRMAAELAEHGRGKAPLERAAVDACRKKNAARSRAICTMRSALSFLLSTSTSPPSRGLPIRGAVPRSPGRFSQPWKPSPTCSGRSGQCSAACVPVSWPISAWSPRSRAWSISGAGGIRELASNVSLPPDGA